MSGYLKVGVVGAGVFAGYHAGKVFAHDRAILSGVFDRNIETAEALAGKYDAAAFNSLSALAEVSDALIIAVPASFHMDAALVGLDHGCHLLVEKPLASSVDQAEQIVSAADKAGRVLQVGHQERIVTQAIGLHDIKARPLQINIVRHTPRATRNLDASVVMDLMVHDLDLLCALYGTPDWINTEMAKRLYSDELDEVRAEAGFGEMTAYLSASRDADLDRRWVLRYPNGTIEIDFGQKTLRHDTPFTLDADFGSRPHVQDNLAAAFDCFVRACLDGERPLATGEDGLAAVRAAAQIEGTL
ncbi:MAG: Gfo/Idh/MocA family protein [Litorimonas sp.]